MYDNSEALKKYDRKIKKSGLIKKMVIIPNTDDARKKCDSYAKRLRKAAGKLLPRDS